MKNRHTSLKRNAAIALACAALALAACWLARTPRDGSREYAGSASCRECHEAFYQRWAPSHHGKAMQPVTPAMARATLTPPAAPIAISNLTYTVDLLRLRITETPPTGRPAHYPIRYALGGKNIFYFLTPLDKGKLQVLPVAYDVNAKAWFDTTGSAVRHFAEARDAPLHWRDPMLTFNTACFGCHVSQLEKNYDPRHGTYRTTWREPGISCETCHGPAAAHVRAFRALRKKNSLGAKAADVAGTLELLSFKTFTPSQVNSACAPCHAKMHPLTRTFTPGDDFFDHYGLVCLEDPDFSADGRDLGENYTYTLWLMNPCAKRGKLDCAHCHTSSGRYRFAPTATNGVNAACASCHADKAANLTAHSHHPEKKLETPPGAKAPSEAGTLELPNLGVPPGAKAPSGAGTLELPNSRTLELPLCTSCHMPQTAFAAMRRSDHSHRPPCPEAAERFGATSACILCHTAKDEAWAAGHVRKWFPDNTRRAKTLREGGLIAAARKRDATQLGPILDYLSEADAEPVICASLLRLLRNIPSGDPRIGAAARAQTAHAHPLVRSAAAAALADDLASRDSADALLRALDDPVRIVRIHAAQSLAAYPRTRLDKTTLRHLERAEAELTEMFDARPDDWASHYNKGNYRLARGDAKGAMAAYRESMRLRDDTVMPHVNAAVLASQNGDLQEAIGYLRKAHDSSPAHGAVNLNLGLALAEAGDLTQAERHLRAAMSDPDTRAQAAYNCAVIIGTRDPRAAAGLCREALTRDPNNPRYREALDYYSSRSK